MALEISNWLDVGNGERSSVVTDPKQPGNYKTLLIRPWPDGTFYCYVNGAFRGREPSMRKAKTVALRFACAQLEG